jgi:hypothetical protein
MHAYCEAFIMMLSTNRRDDKSHVEGMVFINALEAFKSEVAAGASVGKLPYGRLIKE